MADEIKGFDRLGNKISFSGEQRGAVEKLGGRVATAEELTQAKLEAEYAQKTTGQKVGQALLGGGVGPQSQAFLEGAKGSFTAGANQVLTKEAADAIRPGAGKNYAERLDNLETAYPGTTTAGKVTGIAAATATSLAGGGGASGGLARLLPQNAVAPLGALAEAGAARAFGGVAARGALGRAAATAGSLAARGSIETAAIAGLEQASSDLVHDRPITGEKLYAAVGNGAISGGLLSGALGFGGSLAMSGARGIASRAARSLEASAARAEAAASRAETAALTPKPLAAIDADAGMRAGKQPIEFPFQIGAERRPMQLKPGGRPRAPDAEPAFNFGRELKIDPDAGLHAPQGKASGPLSIGEGGVSLGDVEGPIKMGPRPVESRFTIGVDPEAGLAARNSFTGKFQGKVPTEDAFRPSAAKQVPHDVSLKPGEAGEIAAQPAIKLPGATAPEAALLASESNPVRKAAQEQAFNAIGSGFGLQSTRYAKLADRFGGKADLGEIAIRHGLIDMGAAEATPMQAALSAARSGTPAHMVPKIETALEVVGEKYGKIADSSGARVSRKQILDAIDEVAGKYESTAATKPMGRSLRVFGEDLIDSLGVRAEGATTDVRSVIRERRGIDQISFADHPTLNPNAALQAKRELRWKLEDIVTDTIDRSHGGDGKVAAEYKALRRDYHGLSILKELAEDSAARASKASFFGFAEKIGLMAGLATGNVGAPALALGSKLAKERGNAAAAAFLHKAADRGTFNELIATFNRKLDAAASGVVSSSDGKPRQLASKPTTPAGQAQKAVDAKAQQRATVQKATEISKWIANVRANPRELMSQLEEASAAIGRAAGPKAAEAYVMQAVRSIAFVSSYIPVRERRDPLDPRSVPPISHEDASKVVRAARYAAQPQTVYEDFGQGIVTPVGIHAAKEFTPEAYDEFRLKLFNHVQDQMVRNRSLTQAQRLNVSKLLGYPAGPDFRPQSIARLQANFVNAPAEAGAPPANPTGPKPPSRPVSMRVQQSGFDAIEARRTAG